MPLRTFTRAVSAADITFSACLSFWPAGPFSSVWRAACADCKPLFAWNSICSTAANSKQLHFWEWTGHMGREDSGGACMHSTAHNGSHRMELPSEHARHVICHPHPPPPELHKRRHSSSCASRRATSDCRGMMSVLLYVKTPRRQEIVMPGVVKRKA